MIAPVSPQTNFTKFSQLAPLRFYSSWKFLDTLHQVVDQENIICFQSGPIFQNCDKDTTNTTNTEFKSRKNKHQRPNDIPGKPISYLPCVSLKDSLAQLGISPAPEIRSSYLVKKLKTTSSSVFHHDFLLTTYRLFGGVQLGKTYKALFSCNRRGFVEEVWIPDTFIEYAKFKDENIIFSKGHQSIYQLSLFTSIVGIRITFIPECNTGCSHALNLAQPEN